MSLARFLMAIREGERAPLPLVTEAGLGAPISAGEQLEVRAQLESLDAEVRLELVGNPPGLVLPAARWGAEILYRASQSLLSPGIGEVALREILGRPCPGDLSAAVIYSVDLPLRYFPDLLVRAESSSDSAQQLPILRELAKAWPLSSVGVPGVTPDGSDSVRVILDDPSLCGLYVDRILRFQDKSRLEDPATRKAVRTALGAHGSRFPALLECLS